jgi:hypothetical protein
MDRKKERKHVKLLEEVLREEKEEAGMKKGGAVKKYAMGGPAMTPDEAGSLRRAIGKPRIPKIPPALASAVARAVDGMRTPPTTMPIRPPAMKKGGKVEMPMPKAKDMGKLGMARGGGVEAKGKTKGKMLRGGGSCK